MNESPLHSVSVAGVTFDEAGRVLLIRRRDTGELQAPGGVLELRETFEEGVIREVLEETGVLVQVQNLSGVYKNLARGVVALVYRCRYVRGEPTTSSESTEVRWAELEPALEQMVPAFAVRVRDAANSIPASRAHDGVNLVRRT